MTTFISISDAAAYLTVSKSTIWRLQQSDPSFPTAVKISPRRVAFKISDLDRWLEQQQAKNDSGE